MMPGTERDGPGRVGGAMVRSPLRSRATANFPDARVLVVGGFRLPITSILPWSARRATDLTTYSKTGPDRVGLGVFTRTDDCGQDMTIVAASAVRWSFDHGGPSALRGP